MILRAVTQGRPSPNRANLGLSDAIPLALKKGPFRDAGGCVRYSIENSEEPRNSVETGFPKEILGIDGVSPSRSRTLTFQAADRSRPFARRCAREFPRQTSPDGSRSSLQELESGPFPRSDRRWL